MVPRLLTPEQEERAFVPGVAPVAETAAAGSMKMPEAKDRISLVPPVPVEGKAEESTTGLKELLGPGRDRSMPEAA
jgi:hypothetical protein